MAEPAGRGYRLAVPCERFIFLIQISDVLKPLKAEIRKQVELGGGRLRPDCFHSLFPSPLKLIACT